MKPFYAILLGLVCVACTATTKSTKVSVQTPIWADTLGNRTCFTCFPTDIIKFSPRRPPLPQPVVILPTLTIVAKRKVTTDEVCNTVDTGILRNDINGKLDCVIIKILNRGYD